MRTDIRTPCRHNDGSRRRARLPRRCGPTGQLRPQPHHLPSLSERALCPARDVSADFSANQGFNRCVVPLEDASRRRPAGRSSGSIAAESDHPEVCAGREKRRPRETAPGPPRSSVGGRAADRPRPPSWGEPPRMTARPAGRAAHPKLRRGSAGPAPTRRVRGVPRRRSLAHSCHQR